MTAVVDVRTQKSTIVRFFSAPAPVRAAFWFLERAAPGLGARWAERIWFTLPAQGAGQRSRSAEPVPGGAAFTLVVDGREIAGEVWGDGPSVYLMHGWAGHRGQLTPFVAPLVASGHRVITFDAPSHGASGPGPSGPRSSSIPEFSSTLAAVVASFGHPSAIIAHSMGATAAAVALCDGLRADRLIMVAPMAGPKFYVMHFAALLGFGERTLKRLVTRTERRVGAPMHHFDIPAIGQAIAMPPTLIVHDREDTSTPVSDGAAIAAAWPGARLRVTSGLGHRRILRDPGVVAEVVEFATS